MDGRCVSSSRGELLGRSYRSHGRYWSRQFCRSSGDGDVDV